MPEITKKLIQDIYDNLDTILKNQLTKLGLDIEKDKNLISKNLKLKTTHFKGYTIIKSTYYYKDILLVTLEQNVNQFDIEYPNDIRFPTS